MLGRRRINEKMVLEPGLVVDTGQLRGIAIVRVTSGQQVFTQRVIIE